MQRSDPPLGRHEVGKELQTPHVVTNCHRVGEAAGVVGELGAHRVYGVAAAEAKPGDVGFVEIVRLKCEHETGFVAPLGVRGVMPLEEGLHAAQGSVICEEM